MGLMGFFNFALLCIDFLGWPIFALGYPLCASVRAIETGSNSHMRKLVMYWTLFSLVSLFEVTFAKIIQWIPFWSCIKLTLVCWLVIPRFNGACHAYQILVCPCLSVSPRAVMSRLNKPKEEKPLKTETFLDAAEKYIKENGSEALEKLISSKLLAKEPNNSQRDSRVQEPEEKIATATSKQLKEADASEKDIKMSKALEKSASTEAKQVQHAKSNNVVQSEKVTAEAAEIKEMTQLETSAENRHPETPPLKKVQQEWTCALCQVTTTSERTLNEHLKGSKHKYTVELLKTIKNNTKNTRSSPSTTDKSSQGSPEAVKSKVGNRENKKSSIKIEERVQFHDQQKHGKQKQDALKKVQQEWMCVLCQVTTTCESNLNDHLKGSKHKSKFESLKTIKNNTENTQSSPSTTGKSSQGNPEAVKGKVGKGENLL